MPAPFEAFFLPVTDPVPGQRFCIFHPARGPSVKGAVVYVHPFAEEMNKSRRMAAMQSRALAEAGYGVLQIDLLGCGDSSGDFGDASWQDWIDDVLRGCTYLQREVQAPLWIWGLRAGCLLAVESAARLEAPPNLILWAPTPSGKALLQQFLRLKAAATLAGGNAKTVTDGIRADLARGRAVEIAGYKLSPGLASGLEQATLQNLRRPGASGRVEWFELTTRDDGSASPAAMAAFAAWTKNGSSGARLHVSTGPAFWQTTEIEDAPAWLRTTIDALAQDAAT